MERCYKPQRQILNSVNIRVFFQLSFPLSLWGVGAVYLVEIKGRHFANLGHNTICGGALIEKSVGKLSLLKH